MLICARCGSINLTSYIERVAGEVIFTCELCEAQNIVIATLEVVGWRT